MSTIDEVRAADRKVQELLEALKLEALKNETMDERGQLSIQLQQATDEYAKAVRELPI